MDQQSFIYRFLLAPQLRIWRYVTLIIFFTIVTLNQALVGYNDFMPLMGNNLYWILAITILVYVVTVYLISKLVFKYLLSGKYIQFVSYIIACALLFIAIPNLVFYLYIGDYDFFSASTLIDNLSEFIIYVLCISGVIIPVFLKHWMLSNQHLNQLKVRQATSQIEQFKEQINPPSFFKILNSSKVFVKTEPNKASAMLMKLSQLLRYQLYDCNREQVLLTAEISFLKNFLELEKLHSSDLNYTIFTEGDIIGIFVSPSVLLPYVQSVINTFKGGGESYVLDISLTNVGEAIFVTLGVSGTCDEILLQRELLKVRERLNTLYQNRYELIIYSELTDEVKMILKLEK